MAGNTTHLHTFSNEPNPHPHDENEPSPVQTSEDPSVKSKDVGGITRKRQLQINAASRRSRKRKKDEMEFLRMFGQVMHSHVMEHSRSCPRMAAELRNIPLIQEYQQRFGSSRTTTHAPTTSTKVHHAFRNITEEDKLEMLTVASFVRKTLAYESLSFAADAVSLMPISIGQWDIRLSITEKNYSIHAQKFFPYPAQDIFNFCWENHLSLDQLKDRTNQNHFSRILPLDDQTVYVTSRAQGRWTKEIHGVPNVNYTSLLCKGTGSEQQSPAGSRRLFMCQQSLLSDHDFQDPKSTIPWLFKRWVVMHAHVNEATGEVGTLVESYRTASYGTGQKLYSKTQTYDSFCEHIIKRYAESVVVVEKRMAMDDRFPGLVDPSPLLYKTSAQNDTKNNCTIGNISDRIAATLLLF